MMSFFTKTVLPILFGFVVIAATVSAQSILGPGSPPPYATDAPIVMDNVFQDKNGNVTVGDLYVDTAFCIGTDCRTSWGNAGAGSCRIETRRVDSSTPGFFTSGPTDSCYDFLTPAAKAAGWAPSGHDNCVTMSDRDCQPPSTCIFTRLVCSGSVANDPTVHQGPLPFPVPGFTKGTTYVCSDTIDNDGDGLIDYPADTNCANSFGTRETPVSGGGGGGGGGGNTNIR